MTKPKEKSQLNMTPSQTIGCAIEVMDSIASLYQLREDVQIWIDERIEQLEEEEGS